MEEVTVELDPKKDGTFVARSNKTGKIVAVGGSVDSYVLERQPNGSMGNKFTFTGFRKPPPEPEPEPQVEAVPPKRLPFEMNGHDRQRVIALLRVNSPKTRVKAINYLLRQYKHSIPVNPVEKCKYAVELIVEQEKL